MTNFCMHVKVLVIIAVHMCLHVYAQHVYVLIRVEMCFL